MKRKILTILFVISLLGNVALAVHSQRLANRLSEAYDALVEWNEYYETIPKSFTYYEDGTVYGRRNSD